MAMNDTFNTFRIAEKLSIPQLVQAIKNGSIDPNIGQLVLNNKLQQQKKLQGAMASGQQVRPPIAQENMAAGERMAGIGGMQPQQPTGFSSGGIVGYADGGYIDDSRRPNVFGDERNPVSEFLYNQLYPPYTTPKKRREESPGIVDKVKNWWDRTSFLPAPTYVQMPSQQDQTPPQAGGPVAPGRKPVMDVAGMPVQTQGGGGGGFGGMPATRTMGYSDLLNRANQDPTAAIAELSKQREAEYGAGDKEAFAGIQKLIGDQKNQLADIDKKNLYLSLIKGGLATAAGTSQYALQNIGEGAQAGVDSYIQRDVLNQAMKNQIAQAEQMMKLQEIANAKGNRHMADQYAMNAMQYKQNAAQFERGIITDANQLELQKAALQLQARQIGSTAAYHKGMLDYQNKRADATMAGAQARIMGIQGQLEANFLKSPLVAGIQRGLEKEYGPRWMANPLAMREFNNAKNQFMMNQMQNMGIGGIQGGQSNIPYADEMLDPAYGGM